MNGKKTSDLIKGKINFISRSLKESLSSTNEIISKTIFHVIIDTMGYINMPKGNGKNNQDHYKNWLKQYLIKQFKENNRHCIKCGFTDDQIENAFWNDRIAKLHTLSNIGADYKKKKGRPLLKISNTVGFSYENFLKGVEQGTVILSV